MVLALAVAAVAAFVAGPRLVLAVAGAPAPTRSSAPPWVAAALFVAAWYLPNPDLGPTDSFTRHAVGGVAAWDLLANTVGALTAAIALELGRTHGTRSTAQ